MTEFVTGIAKGNNGEEAGRKAVEKAKNKLDDEKIDFVIVFSSAKYDYRKVLEAVNRQTDNAELLGCSSAGEFTEDGPEAESVAVGLISTDNHKFFTGIGTGLTETPDKAMEEAGKNIPREVEGFPYKSVINLHDGLSGRGTEAAWKTLDVLGQDVKVAGGSAGDDLNMEETFVFQDSRVEKDAVGLGLIASKKPVILTVEHGHKPLSPPMTVTKSDGSKVYEIDGKPAFQAWKEQVKGHAKEELGINIDEAESGSRELSKLFIRYEFGIQSAQGYKVRWPGLTKKTDGPLEFGCNIPEGSVIRVMASPKQDQISAARMAARKAMEKAQNEEIAGAIVFECIVRATILDEQFEDSVQAIKDELNVPILGFETYGEICIERGQMSGFHNSTTVIMLIPK